MTTEYGPRERVRNTWGEVQTGELVGSYSTYNGLTGILGTEQTSAPGTDTSQYTKDMVDWKFRERQAAGEIFNNPFLSVKTEVIPAGLTQFYREQTIPWSAGTATYMYSGQLDAGSHAPDYLALPGIDMVEMTRDVVDKAVTQAYGNRSVVVMATTMALAEGKKTIIGLTQILYRVLDIAIAVKRLDMKFLAGQISPSELANRYMELRYAIRPLMIDAKNIMAAIHDPQSEVRATARGGQNDSVVVSDVISDRTVFTIHGLDIRADFQRTSAIIIEARAGVLCDVRPSDASIWGIDQIVETVWEVIPWSFILGWFVDVASLISSWTPKAGVDELASWVTTKTYLKQSVHMTNVRDIGPQPIYPIIVRWSGSNNKNSVTTHRYPNPNRSVWPSINISLDALKIIDLGIILKGVIAGKVSKLWR